MKRATITEAKNGLSALLDRVKAGDSVLILDRGIPVARLEPITSDPDATDWVRRLERTGVVTPGGGAAPIDLLSQPGPVIRGGASVVDALIEERREGR
jgi:prevent-host-death family protein